MDISPPNRNGKFPQMPDRMPERLPAPQSPPMLQPTQILNIALEAREWEVVLAALNELPMRISRPIFDKLLAQTQLPQENTE